MKFLAGSEIAKRLAGVERPLAGVLERSVLFSAKAIHRLETAARVEALPHELVRAERSELDMGRGLRETSGPRWALEGGTYLLELEGAVQLPPGTLGFLSTHPALLEGGASHPTVVIPGGSPWPARFLPLTVSERGIVLSPDAAVSVLVAAS